MDIFDGARIIARWWFVTAPVLVLSLVGSFVVTSGMQPEYRAEGSVLLQAPRSADDAGPSSNPLLDQSSALTTAATITALTLMGPDVATILAEEGLSTDYEIGAESRTPILLIATRAGSREKASGTALRLAELVDEAISLRQGAADVPPENRVTTSVISLATVGGADYGGRNRIRLAAVAFGVLISFMAAFALEGLHQRRNRNNAEDAQAMAGDDPADTANPRSRSSAQASERADKVEPRQSAVS